MKKFTAACLGLLFIFLLSAPIEFAEASSLSERRKVKSWCKNPTISGTVIGVERIKFGAKKYWTCHWKTKNLEYWWTKKNGNPPYRERVKGKSEGKIPYAPVDESKIIIQSVDSKGGVLETMLSGNVKMYVVIPKGAFIEGGKVSILPYKEMPSSPAHTALSPELGYGAEVVAESPQISTPMYIVFDTSGGAAQARESLRVPFFNRCDPSKVWFNPIVCARKNKVAPQQLVDKNFTVVTPIHNKRFDPFVFIRPTIPTGIPEFIVMQVDRADVYIPQKLDADLLKNLMKDTLGKYTNYGGRLDASAFAKEWGIALTQKQIEDSVLGAIEGAATYSELKKAIIVGQRMLAHAESQNPKDEYEKENWEYLTTDLQESTNNARLATYKMSFDDTERDFTDASVEAASITRDLSDAGVKGASDALGDLTENLGNALKNPPSDSGEAIDAAEAADASGMSVPLDDLQDVTNQVFSDVKANIADILNAAALAQAYGLDEGDFVEKIRKALENLLKRSGLSKRELLDIASIAQGLGLDDIASSALDSASKIVEEPCDALIKKTLKNFGFNECL